MSCESYRDLLPAYLDESLDEVRRTGLRAHLRSCAECRAFAIETDPTLMFSLADRDEPSADRIEACVSGVIAGVRQERLQQRLRPSRRPWLAFAAAVVLAVGASAVWWVANDAAEGQPTIQAEAQEPELIVPAETGEDPPLVEPPPRVEVDMTQEEVRVYQYAIGDDDSTAAVFIVNPGMEL